jgi:hypothetical protein
MSKVKGQRSKGKFYVNFDCHIFCVDIRGVEFICMHCHLPMFMYIQDCHLPMISIFIASREMCTLTICHSIVGLHILHQAKSQITISDISCTLQRAIYLYVPSLNRNRQRPTVF